METYVYTVFLAETRLSRLARREEKENRNIDHV